MGERQWVRALALTGLVLAACLPRPAPEYGSEPSTAAHICGSAPYPETPHDEWISARTLRQTRCAAPGDCYERECLDGVCAPWSAPCQPSYTHAGGRAYDSVPSSGGPVHVHGYYRRDGTYVRPHTRRR